MLNNALNLNTVLKCIFEEKLKIAFNQLLGIIIFRLKCSSNDHITGSTSVIAVNNR